VGEAKKIPTPFLGRGFFGESEIYSRAKRVAPRLAWRTLAATAFAQQAVFSPQLAWTAVEQAVAFEQSAPAA
jgi:hypothetical protein